MAKQRIAPARRISGEVEVPGDKSISHRYAILAALAQGRSEMEHFSAAADCRSTLDCLKRLGIAIEAAGRNGGGTISITGRGLDGMRHSWRDLDAGNSGTTMRLMAGVLAAQSFDSTITGDASLRRRPMRRVMDPLRLMGANVRAREDNFAPLEIHGRALHPIQYVLPVASAQVKSAVLLAGLLTEGETSVEEPVRTRDHTEVALAAFGVPVSRAGKSISIRGRRTLQPGRFLIPGDLSAAVFFLAAALVLPDSSVAVQNVGLNPTRSAVLDVLAGWGARPSIAALRSDAGEVVGAIGLEHAPISGGVLSGPVIAQLIDELPMLAALGPYTAEGVEIRDAAELRAKESDRLAVLAENLRRMGARVEERPDGLRVEGRSAGQLHGADLEPHGDHRMAMALAVAALGASSASQIRDPECVAISYPDFFETLDRLTER